MVGHPSVRGTGAAPLITPAVLMNASPHPTRPPYPHERFRTGPEPRRLARPQIAAHRLCAPLTTVFFGETAMATGSKIQTKPRWTTAALGTALGTALTLGGLLSVALAINPATPLEIDGNANDDAGGGTDWAAELPLNGPGETFIIDQVPPLGTETFFQGGGSKDDNNPTKWGNNTGTATNPNKNNITNAYAKAINVQFPASDQPGHPAVPHDHLIIYFGADRFDNEGDAALGFWFTQNEIKINGNGFTGDHTDKDILVQVDYVNGGARAEIQVFKWQGDGTGTHGSPKVLKELAFGGADGVTVCNAASPSAPANTACATTNEFEIDEFWAFVPNDPSPPNKMPARSFFEGGIDITTLIGPVCFSSFLAETRSSHSETAQLKDFALGNFDLCNVKVTKACDTTSPVYIPGTDLFKTEHVVTISNDGFGSVFDVQFQDNSITSTTQCDIIKIGNTVQNPTIPIGDNDDWKNVVNELAGGTSIPVRLMCLSPANSFANQVTVRASSTDNGTPIVADTDDTDTEDADNVAACHLDIQPLVDLTKDCKGLSINPTTFKPQVCATIKVTNPIASGQYLDVSSIKNYPGTGGVVGTGVNVTAAFQTANGGSLALPNNGLPVSFDICYEPTAADSGAGNPDGTLDPSKVKFSDTVEVVAIGRAADAEVKDSDDAFCKLCPECPACPTP
ncbi:hypothetical protein J2X06_000426 [Lysobacter niastensis]|uniref:DUF11 domain-containing protein n=1 Tax=Lysobacter niastensis TaxID=380629 RepID=A0ABU1W6L7_9GAMM|nr:hypothetical protein [Lysobacter niastensis]MDR7133242.1 hypothetical protein [Lysobacter niastensis]